MFYGFCVAWVLVCLYAVTLHLRERKLQDELRRLKDMIEDQKGRK
jgi:CcmD family protein